MGLAVNVRLRELGPTYMLFKFSLRDYFLMNISNEVIPFIQKVSIDGLFGHKNIDWDLNDVNVLVGANGSGKSTILKMIHLALTMESSDEKPRYFENVFEVASRMQIDFKNGYDFRFAKVDENNDDVKNLLALLSEFETIRDSFNNLQSQTKSSKDESELLENKKKIDRLINHLNNSISDKTERKVRAAICNYVTDSMEGKAHNKLLDKIDVVYLSTFDMMLLSKKEYDEIQGEIFTQLDLEIDREVRKFTRHQLELSNKISDDYIFNKRKKDFSKIKEQAFRQVHVFQSALNELFNPHEKHFQISPTGDIDVIFFGEKISLSCLSSGEKQLLLILLKVVNSSERASILLLDEPEISLHLDWQEKLIRIIKDINNNCQIIIVTHSPAVVMSGWLECLVDIKELVVD